ncbi:DUF5367 family protein [Candidatus Woesearchaeota archaeon]|nr:DUF5367 family protein [Candidatus Woesearchaeota archaeon]
MPDCGVPNLYPKVEQALSQLSAVLFTPSLKILNLPVSMKKRTTSTARAIAAIIIVLIEMLCDFLYIIYHIYVLKLSFRHAAASILAVGVYSCYILAL